MKNFFGQFKIPTLLGLSIILIGIGVGVFLTLNEQIIISKAAPDLLPKNINVTNITEDSVSISWQTNSPTSSFISFGILSPNDQTAFDDRDDGKPVSRLIHYVTLQKLLPKTTYQYKIISGKISSEINKFTTAVPLVNQTGYRPIIGSALDGDKPLDEGIVFLSIAQGITQSSLIKSSGNFLIPISQLRKSDLSDIFPLADDTVLQLTIFSTHGEANERLKLKDAYEQIPPISLGQNLDFPTVHQDINSYDVNGDGKINAADYAIILQNLGKKGKNIKGDLNMLF